MRRLLVVSLTFGLMLGATTVPAHLDGHARTNEGRRILLLNPANGAPIGGHFGWDIRPQDERDS